MKIALKKRHYGVHSLVKEIDIMGKFDDYVKEKSEGLDEFDINENLLIEKIPSDLLPTSTKSILLVVNNGKYSTGLRDVKQFRKWSKYFDSYSLELIK